MKMDLIISIKININIREGLLVNNIELISSYKNQVMY